MPCHFLLEARIAVSQSVVLDERTGKSSVGMSADPPAKGIGVVTPYTAGRKVNANRGRDADLLGRRPWLSVGLGLRATACFVPVRCDDARFPTVRPAGDKPELVAEGRFYYLYRSSSAGTLATLVTAVDRA